MSEFDKELKKNLLSIEKEIKQILKTIKKPLLDYNVQFAIDSLRPGRVEYSVWIQPPDSRLNRLSWIGDSVDDLLKQLKEFDGKVDGSTVEIAYHQAQISACKDTIAHHEQVIKELVEKREKPEIKEDA